MALKACNGEASLAALPPELLAQIVVHIDTARVLSYLALTSKKAHAFVENDGFRIFVQTRFPYVSPPIKPSPSFWKDAALGMTSLAKNWDRKAFIAWSINPQKEVTQDLGSHRSRGRRAEPGQTMGFTPVIDSYDAWYGGDWTSRKEVVAWGAGAALCMRTKIMGKDKDYKWQNLDNKHWKGLNSHDQRYAYATYNEEGASEGLDDITSVRLLPEQSLNDSEHVIIGRASSSLALVGLSSGTGQSRVVSAYETQGRPVRSAAIRSEPNALLAACLSDSTVALYPIDPECKQVHPISQICAFSSNQTRTWSSHFLSRDRLVLGLGPSQEPLHVYNIGQGEISRESVRRLELDDFTAEARLELRGNIGIRSATSVYSIAPIDASSSVGRAEGDIFLSGAYDGLTCLHDLRSPNSITAVFRDPVDTFSPIYSLLPIGTERFVAGGARHSIIKVFDLRMPSGKHYYEAKPRRRGWNVFLRPKETPSRRVTESPVYALSRPSQCSPTFFAGVESTILQIDMVSVMDNYPDPLFKYGQARIEGSHDIERKWDPQGKVLCLPMYEHDTGPVKLIKQRKVEHTRGSIGGWDERWQLGETWPVDHRRHHRSWGLV